MSRVKFDYYLLALLATVAVAAVLPARGAAEPIAKYAVTVAVFLLFFLYGARLSSKAVVDGIAHWRLQSLVLLSTFVLFPVIGLGLTAVLSRWLPAELAAGLIFVCVLPSTVQSSIAFTSIARGNVPAALCSASVSNLLGMVLTPLLVAALLATHGSGFSLQALGDIAVELLLPFGLGQVLRPWIGPWITRQKHVLSYVDRGSILLVVYSAFSESVVAGVWSHMNPYSLLLILTLDAVLLAAVLFITTMASRAMGFSKEDEITIVFCGSKKSLASGIPMANILFPAMTVGAVVLPLMIFHQIQLFVCATLAQRYARRPVASSVPAGEPVRV
ncbi:MAG: bile acid:sodium symporter family protein [Janthinobacterium lividum]